MLCDAEGRGSVQLTQAKALNDATPRWSPDGQWITYDSNVSGLFQIYRMSAEGGATRNVTNDKNPSITASTSRDGKWIYYASQRNGRFDVWKMPSSGGTARQVTKERGVAPLESPDGLTLYYIKDSGGLWKQPSVSGTETQVLPGLFGYNYAPTAKGIYYMKRGEDGRSATVEYLDLQSGAIKVLTQLGVPDLGLDHSPDGRYLIYAQRERNTSDLMLVENFR